MRRSHSPSRWTSLLAGALALVLAPDCTSPMGAGAGEEGDVASGALDETRGVVLTAAVWTLAWDTEGVTFSEEGGLDVETNLGYRVHVASAWILSHSVSFGRCDGAAGGGAGQQAWWSRLPVRAAHAHTEDTDPSTIESSWIEDVTRAREVELSTAFPAARYCRAHWLLARPTDPATGAEGVSMENRSIVVTGTFERGGERVDFGIDTWWPHGSLLDLPDIIGSPEYEVARRDGGARHAFVRVIRHLGTMFDGVDFEVASQDQIDGTVIDNLVDGTDMEIELWAPGEAPPPPPAGEPDCPAGAAP